MTTYEAMDISELYVNTALDNMNSEGITEEYARATVKVLLRKRKELRKDHNIDLMCFPQYKEVMLHIWNVYV